VDKAKPFDICTSTAEHREPCEPRGSSTVLGAPGGEIPPGDSPAKALFHNCTFCDGAVQHILMHCGGWPYRRVSSARRCASNLLRRSPAVAVVGQCIDLPSPNACVIESGV
jgi:hypothetical protein